jgi:hypothetical protein
LRGWALLALLTAALAVPSVAPPTTHAAGAADARVLESRAEAHFRDTIVFHLVAESDNPLTGVPLFWHAADNPVLSAEFPEFTPGTRVTIDHALDMRLNYLPPGLDVAWFWRLTDANGHITDSAAGGLLYMDDSHDWHSQTSGLTTLFWYRGDAAFAQSILDAANRTIDKLGARFNVAADEPIRLVIYGSEDDFAESLPPNSAEWIGGQARPQLRLIVAGIDPTRGSTAEIGRMVPHEVSHLVLYQATRNPYNSPPSWLDEGLAVYNQETPDSRFAGLLRDAVRDGQLIPAPALNSSFPLDPQQALLSYAESASIVAFISAHFGDAKLGALLTSFKHEMAYDEATRSALGVSLFELDAQWKASLGYAGDQPAAPADAEHATSRREFYGVLGVLLGLASCAALLALAVVALVLYSRHRRAREAAAEPQ